jgi:hypothetical protein
MTSTRSIWNARTSEHLDELERLARIGITYGAPLFSGFLVFQEAFLEDGHGTRFGSIVAVYDPQEHEVDVSRDIVRAAIPRGDSLRDEIADLLREFRDPGYWQTVLAAHRPEVAR